MLVGTKAKYHIATDGTVTCVEGTDLRTAELTAALETPNYIPMLMGPWNGYRCTYHTVTTILEELAVVKTTWYGAFGLAVSDGSTDVVLEMANNGIYQDTRTTQVDDVFEVITNITAVGTPQPVYVTLQPYVTSP